MGKGFLSGVLWGSVSGVAVLAVLSLYAPLSADRSSELKTESETSEEQSSLKAAPALETVEEAAVEAETAPELADVTEPVENANEGDVVIAQSANGISPSVIEAEPEVAEVTTAPVAEPEAEEVAEVEAVVPEVVVVEAPTAMAEEVEVFETAQNDGVLVIDAPEPAKERPVGIVIFEPENGSPEVLSDAPAAFASVSETAPSAPRTETQVAINIERAPALSVAPSATLSDDIGQTPVDPVINPAAPSALAESDVEPSDEPLIEAEVGEQIAQAPQPQPVNAPAISSLPGQEGSTAPLIEITQASPNRSTLPRIETTPEEPEQEAAPEDVAPEDNASSANQPITIGVPQTPRIATGVVTGRLPSLGAGSATAPGGSTSVAIQSGDALRENAATPISTAGVTGLMSVILIDAGEAGMAVEQMTELAFPFSVAIDPVAPGAAERAAAYRAAGIEILALPADLPSGGSASDISVAMTSYFDTLPEAVGVLDTVDGKLQSSRALLGPVLGILQETGHALVTFNRGLNSAQQAARRADVDAGAVFRLLDGKSENTGTIKRTLDRAGFNAAKDGSVILLGHTYPETVTTLLEWSLDAKSATLGMVPVSQILIETPAS